LPDPHAFPFDAWRRLAARQLRAFAKAPQAYAEPQGRAALRAAIASHVSFTRAVACSADDVLVTAGAQQAFDLLARILVTPRRTLVALEDPGYPPLRAAFAAQQARLASVPVDDEGLRVDRLPAGTRVICVTPSHQFPLGVAMSARRRAELLAFAREHGAVIIEDDYDGEFRFGGRPLDALQTLDGAASVFYVGTFSKMMFPALRIGFVVAPPWAQAALSAAKQVADWHVPSITQDTLAAFIAEGHLVRHVRKMRGLYAERRDALLQALARHCGDALRLIAAEAGLHVSAHLPGRLPAHAVVERAAAAGLGIEALQRYRATPAARGTSVNGLALGYGLIDAARIDEAVRVLARCLGL
jgi:GntR family transcriptional regulator/MocR family aminotransferase